MANNKKINKEVNTEVKVQETAQQTVQQATATEQPAEQASKTLEQVIADVKEFKDLYYMGKTTFDAPIEFTSFCGKKKTRLTGAYSPNPEQVLEGKNGKLHWICKKENGRVKSVSLVHVEQVIPVAINVPASVALVLDSYINKITWNASHDFYKKLAERNDARKSASALNNSDVKAENGNALLEGLV